MLLLGAALVALAAAPATAQDDPQVQDLMLSSSSLDDSLTTSESNTRVKVTLAADVLFRFDSASLTGRAPSRIAERASTIEENDPAVVRVVGHTDAKGSDSRAGAARRTPVAPTASPTARTTPRGRARSRRVEVVIPR